MDMHDVAAMLGRRPNCKSVDRAMSLVAQGYDLVAIREGGTDTDLAEAMQEYPHASHVVVLARGLTRVGDRVGVFILKGTPEPRLF